MIPVSFDGCFGWLHPGRGSRGVVLCAAFGHENMIAHRGWRRLAEELASQNFHVLRFDYPGTGDSGGSEDDPDRLDAWRASVVSAVRHLQSVSGAREIILVGLRLGATLAVLAAEELGVVTAVACLAPILTGKSYLRELRLRANGWREANLHTPDPQPPDHLDILGDRLAGQTLRDLLRIDLSRIRRSPSHVLLMGAGAGPVASAVADNYRSLGCRVTMEDFPGLSDFLEDSISSRIPLEAFATLVEWCTCRVPERLLDQERVSNPPAPPRQADRLVLHDAAMTERAVEFGPLGHLFAILCQPRVDAGHDMSPVIMLNTGFGRHTGDGRVFTILARRLAAAGIPSLRMDLAGLGDSRGVGGDDAKPYAPGTSQDVKSAIDLLERAGYRDPYLIGICSGAYAAFHAALEDPRIRGLVLVNIQSFLWKQGSSLKVTSGQQRRPLGFYLQAMAKRSAWRRLCRREVAVGAIALALGRRSLTIVRNRLLALLEQLLGFQTSAGRVRRSFRNLNSRGVQVSMFYSESDPGLAELAVHFGRDGHRLQDLENLRLHRLDAADHALFDHTARLRFVEMVLDLMRCRAPNSGGSWEPARTHVPYQERHALMAPGDTHPRSGRQINDHVVEAASRRRQRLMPLPERIALQEVPGQPQPVPPIRGGAGIVLVQEEVRQPQQPFAPETRTLPGHRPPSSR